MASATSCLQLVLILLQVGFAVAIAVVVRQDLWWYIPGTIGTCFTSWWGTYTWCTGEWVCLMTTATVNICSYAWWLAGVSLFLSLFMGFSSACSSRRQAASKLSALAAFVGLIWWIAGAIVTTVNGKNADGVNAGRQDIPPYDGAQSYRTAVWAMAWVEMCLFFFSTLLACNDVRNAPAQQQQQQPAATGYPTGAYAAGPYQQPPPYTAYQQAPPGYAVPPPPPMMYPPPGQPYPAYGPPTGYAAPPPYPPGTSDGVPPKMI